MVPYGASTSYSAFQSSVSPCLIQSSHFSRSHHRIGRWENFEDTLGFLPPMYSTSWIFCTSEKFLRQNPSTGFVLTPMYGTPFLRQHALQLLQLLQLWESDCFQ